MKKANLIAAAGIMALGVNFSEAAELDVEIIDDNGTITNAITAAMETACTTATQTPTPPNTVNCVGAVNSATYTIAKEIHNYLRLLSINLDELAKTNLNGAELGYLNGQFAANCTLPLSMLAAQGGITQESYIQESGNTIGACFNFIEGEMADTLGQSLLPTPRNAVAAYMNPILKIANEPPIPAPNPR